MMSQPSERAAVIAFIEPDAYAAAEYNTKGTSNHTIDMSKWAEIMVVAMIGTMASNATVDIDVEVGSDNSTFGTTIKSATQLTEAGTDSDKVVVLNVKAEEVCTLTGQNNRYVNIETTIGTAACDFGLVVLGMKPAYPPASANDLAAVDEIVS